MGSTLHRRPRKWGSIKSPMMTWAMPGVRAVCELSTHNSKFGKRRRECRWHTWEGNGQDCSGDGLIGVKEDDRDGQEGGNPAANGGNKVQYKGQQPKDGGQRGAQKAQHEANKDACSPSWL